MGPGCHLAVGCILSRDSAEVPWSRGASSTLGVPTGGPFHRGRRARCPPAYPPGGPAHGTVLSWSAASHRPQRQNSRRAFKARFSPGLLGATSFGVTFWLPEVHPAAKTSDQGRKRSKGAGLLPSQRRPCGATPPRAPRPRRLGPCRVLPILDEETESEGAVGRPAHGGGRRGPSRGGCSAGHWAAGPRPTVTSLPRQHRQQRLGEGPRTSRGLRLETLASGLGGRVSVPPSTHGVSAGAQRGPQPFAGRRRGWTPVWTAAGRARVRPCACAAQQGFRVRMNPLLLTNLPWNRGSRQVHGPLGKRVFA